jgi:fibronectin-binding autotransporter adhesin
MKSNRSFSETPRGIFFLAAVTLLLLLTQSVTFAGSASWNDTGSAWNTNADWTPNTGYPGTTAGDTATFDLANTFTSVGISAITTVAAITFSNLATNPYTITANPGFGFLTINDTGITNSSGKTQNFVTAVNGSGAVGTIEFTNSATAGSMTSFTNNGATVSGAVGGRTVFVDTSTADHGTFTNNGATVSGAVGGSTQFFGSSTAGSATITNNGGTVSGADGGVTEFFGTSTADSATLIANGGTGAGGSIFFFQDSTGGTASVDVRNNGSGAAGNLDISFHNAPGVTIGSLEGSGNAFLGANNLTVGSNNLSKTFSGVIQDGGFLPFVGGSLTKIGTGAFTLTGANTYTGGTTVNAGSLFVNNTGGLSGTGTGAVTVNGGTLGGGNGTAIASTISGAVTVNSGANLAPGPTGNGSTGILNTGAFTLNSGSNFSLDLNGPLAGTSYDQVDVTGAVFVTGSNLVLNSVSGLTVGDTLFIVENDGIDPVTGTFAGLANGATFTADGVTFQIDYFASGQGGGNDIELAVESVRPVPEPSTWVAGALACAFVAYTQRRRFAQMLRRA